jgi:hypothetical protein
LGRGKTQLPKETETGPSHLRGFKGIHLQLGSLAYPLGFISKIAKVFHPSDLRILVLPFDLDA